jgi:hypothetical protein
MVVRRAAKVFFVQHEQRAQRTRIPALGIEKPYRPQALKDVVKHKRHDAFDDYLGQLGMLADPPPRKAAKAPRAKA